VDPWVGFALSTIFATERSAEGVEDASENVTKHVVFARNVPAQPVEVVEVADAEVISVPEEPALLFHTDPFGGRLTYPSSSYQ
jgi:hypothetical protein